MNEDEMAIAEPLAGEELERTLGRYARVRLDPSQAQRRRARSAVMEEAWRRRIDPTGSAAAGAGYRPVRRALFAGWTTRRIAASLSAAALAGLMVGTSVFAGSRAGGPLYESRLALEALTLPSDAGARVDAQLAQAQARLAEAVEATGSGDDRAAIAALDAYDAAIDRLMAVDGVSAARAREAVQFHRSVLLEVAANAPAGAAGGLERALENSSRVIEALGTDRGNGSQGGAGAGNGSQGGSGAGNGAGNGNPGANSGPATTAAPVATTEPGAAGEPTAKPGKSPDPEATAKPDMTPPPHRTPDPPKPDASDGRDRQPGPSDARP
jgi:hypothetical protein